MNFSNNKIEEADQTKEHITTTSIKGEAIIRKLSNKFIKPALLMSMDIKADKKSNANDSARYLNFLFCKLYGNACKNNIGTIIKCKKTIILGKPTAVSRRGKRAKLNKKITRVTTLTCIRFFLTFRQTSCFFEHYHYKPAQQ